MTESGQLASGRFTIRRRIGAGGMGVVYEAFDRDRNHVVALKKLLGTDATAIYRLKSEFRALADVVHPNLVRLYELIGEEDDWFFTMELVDGVDFLHAIRGSASLENDATTERSTIIDDGSGRAIDKALRERPIREPREPQLVPIDFIRLRRTLRQLADGVAALHDAGKLHRDLKPSNVLVTPAGRVVILDFGLTTDVSPIKQQMTFGGTPAYMAPEQIAELPPTDASDCYAMGVMLYEALTGTLPFSGNFYSMLMQKRTTDPHLPPELARDVPDDLANLCAALLKRAPEERPGAREVMERVADQQERARLITSTTTSRPRELPFVGRAYELQQLEEAFEATQQGAPVTMILRGASGMGKSSLVRHFLTEVQHRDPGVIVFSGRSYEQESVPYKALDSLIDDLARYLRQVSPLEAKALMPTDVAALARLFPVLQELQPVAKAKRKALEIRDSQEVRRRAFAALRELLSRMTDEHRVILHLDDVQWGDRDSASLLAEVLRPPDAPPVLVIAAHRIEEQAEASPMLSELRRLHEKDNALGELRELTLGELQGDEARDLTRMLLHEQSAPAERVEAIAREARGSPFFIVELARFSDATGAAAEGEGRGGLVLDQLIRARIAQLPEVARDLLEIVSLAGRPILGAAANAAANLRADDEAMLARLRADHLLRTRVRGGRDEVDTYHDRIREAIVSALPADRRRALHLNIAQTLELHGGDPEVLSVHYLGAGQSAKAAVHALEAGTRAAAALAFDNAAHFFAMALALEAGESRVELMLKLANALANAGRGAEAAQYYLRAAEHADEATKLELWRRASEGLLRGGHVDEGLRIIRAVLGSVGLKLPATPMRAVLGILLGRVRMMLRGLDFHERKAEEVPQSDLTRVDVAWGMTTGLARIDNIRSAYFQSIHLPLSLDAGEPYRVARAMAAEACFSATFGVKVKQRTEKLVLTAQRSARRVADPHALGMVMLAQSLESYYLGRFREGFTKAEEAEKVFRERCTGAFWEISTSVNYALCSLVYLGEVAQLAPRVAVRLREAEERGDLYAGIDPVSRPGIVWLAADDPEGGRRAMRNVMDRWSLEGFHYQHYLEMFAESQIDLYEGDGAGAFGRIEERWPALEKSFLLRVPFAKIEALHLRARAALATSGAKDDSFLDGVERDAKAVSKIRSSWSEAFAVGLRAGVAFKRGRRDDAERLLQEAERAFERSEMMLYANAVMHRRGTLIGDEVLVASATFWMQAQGIRNPERMLDVLLPGFSS